MFKKAVLIVLLLLVGTVYAEEDAKITKFDLQWEHYSDEARPVVLNRALKMWDGPKTVTNDYSGRVYKNCDRITEDMGTLKFRSNGKDCMIHGIWSVE